MNYPLIISRLFEPIIIVLFILVLALYRSGLNVRQVLLLLGVLIPFAIFIPIFIQLASLKSKKITDWDIKDRKQRPIIFFLLLLSNAIGLVLIRTITSGFIFHLYAYCVAWFLGLFIITLFYKISGHVSMNMLVWGLVVAWYGERFWPLLFIAPIMAWARVKGKFHTPGQVFAGAAYSGLFILLSIYFHLIP